MFLASAFAGRKLTPFHACVTFNFRHNFLPLPCTHLTVFLLLTMRLRRERFEPRICNRLGSSERKCRRTGANYYSTGNLFWIFYYCFHRFYSDRNFKLALLVSRGMTGRLKNCSQCLHWKAYRKI